MLDSRAEQDHGREVDGPERLVSAAHGFLELGEGFEGQLAAELEGHVFELAVEQARGVELYGGVFDLRVVEDHFCGGVGEDGWVADGADCEAELQDCVDERVFLLRRSAADMSNIGAILLRALCCSIDTRSLESISTFLPFANSRHH